MLLVEWSSARTFDVDRVERRGLVRGTVTDVRLDAFDDVVSLDEDVLGVRVRGEGQIELVARGPGTGVLLIRRGGFVDQISIRVEGDEDSPGYRSGMAKKRIRGEAFTSGQVGATLQRSSQFSTVPLQLGLFTGGAEHVSRSGTTHVKGRFALQTGSYGVRLPEVKLSLERPRLRVAFEDYVGPLPEVQAWVLQRGLQTRWRALDGRRKLDLNLSVGVSRSSRCCRVFDADRPGMASAFGGATLTWGDLKTTLTTGAMVVTPNADLVPMVGLSGEYRRGDSSVDVALAQVGEGQLGSGRLVASPGRLSLQLDAAFASPGSWRGRTQQGRWYGLGAAQLGWAFGARRSTAVRVSARTTTGAGTQSLAQTQLLAGFSTRLKRIVLDAAWQSNGRWSREIPLAWDHLATARVFTTTSRRSVSGTVSVTLRKRSAVNARAEWLEHRAFGSLGGGLRVSNTSGAVEGIWSAQRVHWRALAATGPFLGLGKNRRVGWTGRASLSVSPVPALELTGSATARLGQGQQAYGVRAGVTLRGAKAGPMTGHVVRGRAFEDLDDDGLWGPNEPQIPNVMVHAGGAKTLTKKNGAYRIGQLPTERVPLSVQAEGYRLRNARDVEALRGRAVRVDLPLVRNQRVEVRVFVDADGDRQFDLGEELVDLEGVSVTSTAGTDRWPLVGGVASRSGQFEGSLRVAYDVLDLEDGYLPNGPEEISLDMDATGRAVAAFAVRPIRDVEGRVCLDENQNGRFDGADRCEPGTSVRLDGGHPIQTREDGKFAFRELQPGTHTLTCEGCLPYAFQVEQGPTRLRKRMVLRTEKTVEKVEEADRGAPIALRVQIDNRALKVGDGTGLRVVATYADFSSAPIDARVQISPAGLVKRVGPRVIGLRPGVVSVVAQDTTLVSPAVELVVERLPLVGLTASPRKVELPAGDLHPIDVRAVYIDGDIVPMTDSLTWTSSNPAVARVEGNGVVVGVAPGRTIVRGEHLGISTNPIEVRITTGSSVGKVVLSPETLVLGRESRGRLYLDATLTQGGTVQLSEGVRWFVDDPGVVRVEPGGRLQPTGIGRTTVYARYDGLQTPRAQVEVVPSVGLLAQPTFGAIPVGGSTPMKALEVLADGSFKEQGKARWRSLDASIATIDGNVLTAHAAGSTRVVAMHRDLESLPLEVVVVEAQVEELRLEPAQIEVASDTQGYIDAIAAFSSGRTAVVTQAATWVIADPAIASVDTDGVITGRKPGRTLMKASWMGEESAPIPVVVGTAVATLADAVMVEPASVQLSAEGSQELAVSVLSETGHVMQARAIRWEVADPSVAWVEQGVVKAVSVGTTQITAVQGDVRSLPVTVTVNPIVGVTAAPALGRLPVGARIDLKAMGVVDDGSLEDITAKVRWSSSDPQVLQINEDGSLLAFKAGRASVRANWRNMKTLPMVVDVADVDLTGLTVDAGAASVRVGDTMALAAVAVFGDGVVADATPHVSWTSTRPEVVEIDAGVLHGRGPGVADIFASWMQVDSARVRVTVSVADAVGVILGNASEVMLLGTQIPLRATAITSEGELLDASTTTTWKVEDSSVVRVDANGHLVARAPGETSLVGLVGGHASPPVRVRVTEATLTRLDVEPAALAVAAGEPVELRAMGDLTDGTRADLSPQVVWEIEGEGVSIDRYNRLMLEPGGHARIRARHEDVRSAWAQLVAVE